MDKWYAEGRKVYQNGMLVAKALDIAEAENFVVDHNTIIDEILMDRFYDEVDNV